MVQTGLNSIFQCILLRQVKRLQVETLTALKYYPYILFSPLFSKVLTFSEFMGALLVFSKSKSSWKCALKMPHMHTDSWKSMLSNSCGWISNPAFQSRSIWWISKNLFPPAAGLNPNMNVNNMDITGGLSVKDTSQSQSRLPQWTHPNSMDNLSSAASSLDQNSSKHGNVPWHALPAWLLVIPATVQLELFL